MTRRKNSTFAFRVDQTMHVTGDTILTEDGEHLEAEDIRRKYRQSRGE